MTHNWWIVIEFKCFVCILWQVFIDDIQFFAILTILSIVISTQSWIEFKWFVCTLIRIWSGWHWGEWCSDYRLLRWLQSWLVEEIVWWFFTVFRTLLFTEKPDTRMDEKTVLIKISILDEWKYWYWTFHIFWREINQKKCSPHTFYLDWVRSAKKAKPPDTFIV